MSPTTPHPAPLEASRLLEALDPDQREVAEHLEGPLCVLAGAGTGKTRAITYRIAHGVATGAYQATQVLAVTFTARAAGEMRSRLADLGVPGVQARTFHAAALRQLTYFWPAAIGGRRPDIQAQMCIRDRKNPGDLVAPGIDGAEGGDVMPDEYAVGARGFCQTLRDQC